METTTTDVIVIGAGLAGLTAARLVRNAGLHVVVIDGHGAGGRAATDRRSGFLFNRGPHALYLGGPAERVLSSLGVPLPGSPPPQRVWVRDGDRVVRLPSGPWSMMTTELLGWRGKAALGRLLAGLSRCDPAPLATVSFAAWMDGQGLPDDARRVLRMLGRLATYVDAPELVSADVVVSMLQQALGPGVRYLDGGWGGIVDSLSGPLQVQAERAEQLVADDGGVVVSTAHRRFVAGAAVVATGTPASTARLCGRAAFDVGPPVEASCLDLGTSGPALRPILLGLDQPLYLSDHGAVAALAPAGGSVMHVMRYLAPGEHVDHDTMSRELSEHARCAGVEPSDIVESRRLNRMVVSTAMPTAARGGLPGRPSAADTGLDGAWMAGDWVGAVGHLLDASVASAENAALAACRHVSRRAGGKLSTR
jgi:phytoene dehydrogenase-like protein